MKAYAVSPFPSRCTVSANCTDAGSELVASPTWTPSAGLPPLVTLPLMTVDPECVQLRKVGRKVYDNGIGVGGTGAGGRVGRAVAVGAVVGVPVGDGVSVGVEVDVGVAVGVSVSLSVGVQVGGSAGSAAIASVGVTSSGGLKGFSAMRGLMKINR